MTNRVMTICRKTSHKVRKNLCLLRHQRAIRCVSDCATPTSILISVLITNSPHLVVDPAFGEEELGNGKTDDNHKELPSQGRGIAHIEVLKAVAIYVKHREQSGILGAALSHEQGWDENLERVDDGCDHVKENQRSHQGNDNVDDLAERSSTVDAGGFQ